MMRRGRRLGIDVGSVRIGIATSDPEGLIATPLATVAAGDSAIAELSRLACETEAIEIVVGLPISLDGRESHAAKAAREFAVALKASVAPLEVRLHDERMSTISAASLLRAGGRASRGQRSVIDQAAATVILQAALDAERTRGSAPGEAI